jgi:hypothetical protein
MNVRNMDVDPEITALLGAVMENTEATWAGLPAQAPAVTEADFLQIDIPNVEVYKKNQGQPSLLVNPLSFVRNMPLLEAAGELLGGAEVKNHCVYKARSMMPWHTNRDDPGVRTYYTFTTGRALFRWMDNKGNVHTEVDAPGQWQARQFDVSADYPMWHSIWTQNKRFSFGFLK